jgi:hypothetical protein
MDDTDEERDERLLKYAMQIVRIPEDLSVGADY